MTAAKDAAQAVQHWYPILGSAQEVVQPERRYRMTAAAAQEVLQPQRHRATCAQEVVHVEAMDRAKP